MKKLANLLLIAIISLIPLKGISQIRDMQRVQINDKIQKDKTLTENKTPLLTKPILDFSNINYCSEIHSSSGSLEERNFSAVSPIPKLDQNGRITQVGISRQPLAGETNKMWNPGQLLQVFMDPNNSTHDMRLKIMKIAKGWEKIANIRFEETSFRTDAQIKIGFKPKQGYWSKIGKEALFTGKYDYTMNLENLSKFSDQEINQIVLHEFGHALGFIHEHQSPSAGINWHKENVYAYYAQEPNFWSRETVDQNIFNKYAKTSTNYSAYDKYSIMHYHIPSILTLDGIETSKNYYFSAMDKSYATLLYPFPPTPQNSFGYLRTGDDCDEIVFSVDYQSVPKDVIEVTLILGSTNGRTVTWWKQVVVPLNGNREHKLWVQNHSLIPQENRNSVTMRIPVSDIDKSKGITFWKAKVLGIPTLLNYQWKVWEALPGGTRITLSWNKDRCM